MRRAFLPVLLTAAVLRWIAVVGRGPFIYVDSIDYETLDITGRARRPWVTPLLYELIGDRSLRVIAQAGIGALCWSALAVEASRHVRDTRVRWAVLVGVLALSLCTVVTSWDTAMLSEPVALSLTALLLAAVLRLARTPDRWGAVALVGVFVLWIFTRQNNLVLGGLTALAMLVLALVAWRRHADSWRLLAGLTAALVVVVGVAIASYSRNTEILHYNAAAVLGSRVLLDPEDAQWFVDHGMPESVLQLTLPMPAADLLEDPAFGGWIEHEGLTTYAKFLLTRPFDTVAQPLESIISERPPTFDPDRADEALLLGITYGAAREVLPSPIEDLFVDQRSTGGVVFGMVAVGMATLVTGYRRQRGSVAWLAPLLCIGLQWPALTVVWHGSVGELERLGLVSLVVIWVSLLVQAGILVDAAVASTDDG
jgi:Ca2+/Na+ antiporter